MYCGAACLFTWPLVLHPRTLLGAADATGDASLYLWALGWDFRVISEHPSWLFTGRVFDANIFFPAPRTLAYSDNLLPQALALWPVYAITGDLVLCYNLLFFGSLVAAALAMHMLGAGTDRQRACGVRRGVDLRIRPLPFRASRARPAPGAVLHAAVVPVAASPLPARAAHRHGDAWGRAGAPGRQLHLLRHHRWHRDRVCDGRTRPADAPSACLATVAARRHGRPGRGAGRAAVDRALPAGAPRDRRRPLDRRCREGRSHPRQLPAGAGNEPVVRPHGRPAARTWRVAAVQRRR